MEPRLLLFDVDGTLVDCGRQVRRIFAGALEEVFGRTGDLDGIQFSGKTDPQIVLELITATGVDRDEAERRLPQMRETYVERLDRDLAREEMRLLPGVRPLLERLNPREELAIGLLTGNWRRGARVKLSRFELEDYFAFGAFGDDGIDRVSLYPVALGRARAAMRREFAPQEVLVIGDSRLDVVGARAHGFRSLAVATGKTPAAELAAAGADWVIANLESLPDELAGTLG